MESREGGGGESRERGGDEGERGGEEVERWGKRGLSNENICLQFSIVQDSMHTDTLTLTHTHTCTLSQVKLHPITHISHSPLAHLHRQEQLTSGYPLLSPTGITLTQAVVSLIYQLQEKEPWQSAITQVGRVKRGRGEGEMWEGEERKRGRGEGEMWEGEERRGRGEGRGGDVGA